MTTARTRDLHGGIKARRPHPSGLALIELLVVLLLIVILISLYLAAIPDARQAGLRVTCFNNLRQLSLGMHQYELAHGMLPPGVVSPIGPIDDRRLGLDRGFFVALLPSLDNSQIYEAIDEQHSVYAPENHTVRVTRIASFVCPADPIAKVTGPSR